MKKSGYIVIMLIVSFAYAGSAQNVKGEKLNGQSFFKNVKPSVTWNNGDRDEKTAKLKNGRTLWVKFDRYLVNVDVVSGSKGYNILNVAETKEWNQMQIAEYDFDQDGQNELIVEYGNNAQTKCRLFVYRITQSRADEIGNFGNVQCPCSFGKDKIIVAGSSYVLTSGKFIKAD